MTSSPMCLHGRHKVEDEVIKGPHLLGPTLDSKLEQFRYDIVHKIDKELKDSENARNYISQKYDELCGKIGYLTELDATVSGFRSDVRAVEGQVLALSHRLDDLEKRTICRECPSLASSLY